MQGRGRALPQFIAAAFAASRRRQPRSPRPLIPERAPPHRRCEPARAQAERPVAFVKRTPLVMLICRLASHAGTLRKKEPQMATEGMRTEPLSGTGVLFCGGHRAGEVAYNIRIAYPNPYTDLISGELEGPGVLQCNNLTNVILRLKDHQCVKLQAEGPAGDRLNFEIIDPASVQICEILRPPSR